MTHLLSPPLSFPASVALFSSSGAMWPGIKTETGLPEAPPGGQPGFLSFSSTYTSAQPAHLHYSYPSQGKLQPLSLSLSLWHSSFSLLFVTSATVNKHFHSLLTLLYLSTLSLQAQASQHPACTLASCPLQPLPQAPPQWFNRLVFHR